MEEVKKRRFMERCLGREVLEFGRGSEGQSAASQVDRFTPGRGRDPRGQGIEHGLALPPGGHQTGLAKHPQMVRKKALLDTQALLQIADVERTLQQQTKSLQPSSVGEHLETRCAIFSSILTLLLYSVGFLDGTGFLGGFVLVSLRERL